MVRRRARPRRASSGAASQRMLAGRPVTRAATWSTSQLTGAISGRVGAAIRSPRLRPPRQPSGSTRTMWTWRGPWTPRVRICSRRRCGWGRRRGPTTRAHRHGGGGGRQRGWPRAGPRGARRRGRAAAGRAAREPATEASRTRDPVAATPATAPVRPTSAAAPVAGLYGSTVTPASASATAIGSKSGSALRTTVMAWCWRARSTTLASTPSTLDPVHDRVDLGGHGHEAGHQVGRVERREPDLRWHRCRLRRHVHRIDGDALTQPLPAPSPGTQPGPRPRSSTTARSGTCRLWPNREFQVPERWGSWSPAFQRVWKGRRTGWRGVRPADQRRASGANDSARLPAAVDAR